MNCYPNSWRSPAKFHRSTSASCTISRPRWVPSPRAVRRRRLDLASPCIVASGSESSAPDRRWTPPCSLSDGPSWPTGGHFHFLSRTGRRNKNCVKKPPKRFAIAVDYYGTLSTARKHSTSHGTREEFWANQNDTNYPSRRNWWELIWWEWIARGYCQWNFYLF